MKINLKLVTWELDLTQFLVDAEDNNDAISKAIKSHRIFDEHEFGERDIDDEEESIFVNDMNDPCTYTVEDVDMYMLLELIRREDWFGNTYGDAIVFNG